MKAILKSLPLALAMAASLSAQALTPGSGTWVKETATYGTPNLRDAWIYVPSNPNPQALKDKRAVMLIMNGCSQTASSVMNSYNYVQTAEKYGMVLIAPTAPDLGYGKTYPSGSPGSCWDSVGLDYSRTTRHAMPLKKLMDSVINRSALEIDPTQVYVTGFSGGAAMTMILACTFPDVFAGFGAHAGIAWGTTMTDIKKYPVPAPVPTPEQIATACKAANGNQYNHLFANQLASFSYGTSDTSVPPAHNVRNMAAIAKVYGMDLNPSPDTTIPGNGTLRVYKDALNRERIQEISIKGLAHKWPAGGTTVDYPATLTDWLFRNYLRVTDPCDSMTFSPDRISGGSGSSGTITVTADPQCQWSVSQGDPLYARGSGNGNGTIEYSFTTNWGKTTELSITVAGKRIPATWVGACTITVTPENVSVPAEGGSGTFSISIAGSSAYQDVCKVNPGTYGTEWAKIVLEYADPRVTFGPLKGSYTVAPNTDPVARSTSAYITINQAAGAAPAPCYTDINYKHVMAKRAAYRFTPTFGVTAKGSNADLGSFSKTTSLKMTQPDYYEPVNSCQ